MLLRSFNSIVAGLTKLWGVLGGAVLSITPRPAPFPPQSQVSCPQGSSGRCGKVLPLHVHLLAGLLGGSSWLTKHCKPSIFVTWMEVTRFFILPFTFSEVRGLGVEVALFLISSFRFSWSCHSGEGPKGSLHRGSADQPVGLFWHHLVSLALCEGLGV